MINILTVYFESGIRPISVDRLPDQWLLVATDGSIVTILGYLFQFPPYNLVIS